MSNDSKEEKKLRGKFYTTNFKYILDAVEIPGCVEKVIEPFSGQGDLITWIAETRPDIEIEAYDIDPKHPLGKTRDTLLNPPYYGGSFVVTNPPYLARNKNPDKKVYDKYNQNDLYKCFMSSLIEGSVYGGIIIIPSGFFFSPRNVDVMLRHRFMSSYTIHLVKYFEESVFDDTSTSVVVVYFTKSDTKHTNQSVKWQILPVNIQKNFVMSTKHNWIIGGDVYTLRGNTKVSRYVSGMKLSTNQSKTCMTISALDTGISGGKIKLSFDENHTYQGKQTSRSFATLVVDGIELSVKEQKSICEKFNDLFNKKREETHSLFLPQFRESKEYSRKRVPFGLVYNLVSYIIDTTIKK